MPSAAPQHDPTPDPVPGPRQTCPSCRRPVASARAVQCIYCGKPLQIKVRPSVQAEERAAIAAEFAALGDMGHPQPSIGGMGPWVIRIGALALGALLVFGLLGPCMKG